MEKQENHGFLPDILLEEDYVFGGLKIPTKVLVEDGQWDSFLPEIELQHRNGLETQNCVTYATLNCLEILLKYHNKGNYNKSERYVGVMAGTTIRGNSPQRVIETIRKESGLIDEELLPFDKDISLWDRYYAPYPMTKKYIRIGKKWLKKYKVRHEWVLINNESGNKQEILKQALKYSPLGVSVYAWKWNDIGLYVKDDEKDNHFVTLYGYVDGEFWKVFDHYNDTHKKLEWDYAFNFCKRYYIEKQPLKSNFINRIIQIIISFFKL